MPPTKRSNSTSTETIVRTEEVTKEPPMYRVLFHNDDYTTMEFVVSVLMVIFHHDEASAKQIMMHVHTNGVGVAGRYTREIAETKVAHTTELARQSDFPLEVTIEPE
ncbi:MAG: ATP-dependent Clp protease adaptor ClpS [Deltaproteobacteria bacterium]|nr:ATP-dependent Clp protease adaptor ClpS [Deltaproteobacteria bacterium]